MFEQYYRKFIGLYQIIFLFFLLTALPFPAHATDVGFVPRTGVWFSRDTFLPDEPIKVYTVVINNQYHSLEAEVAFFDNDALIGSVIIADLPKEFSRQIWAAWKPKEGKHRVRVQFQRAVAVDEQGRRESLDVSTLNQTAGQASWLSPTPSGNDSPPAEKPPTLLEKIFSPPAKERVVEKVNEVEVIVKNEADKLVLSPPAEQLTVEQSGQTLDGVTKQREAEPSRLTNGPSDDFGQTTSTPITAPLKELAQSIEQTAGKVDNIYTKANVLVDKGRNLVSRGQAGWREVRATWDNIVGRNEKRQTLLFMAVGLTVMAWLLWRKIKRMWRRDDN